VAAFGGSDTHAAWAALSVAVLSQITWAMAAARQTGTSTGIVILSGLANLVLGLAIVALKTALSP
jgi:hypothetical protein